MDVVRKDVELLKGDARTKACFPHLPPGLGRFFREYLRMDHSRAPKLMKDGSSKRLGDERVVMVRNPFGPRMPDESLLQVACPVEQVVGGRTSGPNAVPR